MSKRYWVPIIEDMLNNGCAETEKEALTELFIYSFKEMATTLARKAVFHLEDYTNCRSWQKGFTLSIERVTIKNIDEWRGTFQKDKKKLYVVGMLWRTEEEAYGRSQAPTSI